MLWVTQPRPEVKNLTVKFVTFLLRQHNALAWCVCVERRPLCKGTSSGRRMGTLGSSYHVPGLGPPHCSVSWVSFSPLYKIRKLRPQSQELSLPDSKTRVLSSPQGSPDLTKVLSSFTEFRNWLLCLLTIIPFSKTLGQKGGCSQEDPEHNSELESTQAPREGVP